jgi:hypothetical protein
LVLSHLPCKAKSSIRNIHPPKCAAPIKAELVAEFETRKAAKAAAAEAAAVAAAEGAEAAKGKKGKKVKTPTPNSTPELPPEESEEKLEISLCAEDIPEHVGSIQVSTDDQVMKASAGNEPWSVHSSWRLPCFVKNLGGIGAGGAHEEGASLRVFWHSRCKLSQFMHVLNRASCLHRRLDILLFARLLCNAWRHCIFASFFKKKHFEIKK